MSFKDVIKQDITNVFLNFEEFATKHNINGKAILAVVDDDLTTERSITDVNNIYYGSKLMYVSAEEIGFKPTIGGNIRLDGMLYQIKSVTDSMGMYEVVMEKYQGR